MWIEIAGRALLQLLHPYPSRVWIENKAGRNVALAVAVTPFTGVWIKSARAPIQTASRAVTPFTGVWIEMRIKAGHVARGRHPSRVCGLKISTMPPMTALNCHTFTGVWLK